MKQLQLSYLYDLCAFRVNVLAVRERLLQLATGGIYLRLSLARRTFD